MKVIVEFALSESGTIVIEFEAAASIYGAESASGDSDVGKPKPAKEPFR